MAPEARSPLDGLLVSGWGDEALYTASLLRLMGAFGMQAWLGFRDPPSFVANAVL